MNTHDIDYNPANFSAAHEIRRNAEHLRGEQTALFFRRFFKLFAAGYGKLASYGAGISTAYQTPKALY
jgi:hypothetical protein